MCDCDLCKCETELDYLRWFYKEVGNWLRGEQNILELNYLHQGLSEFIIEVKEEE